MNPSVPAIDAVTPAAAKPLNNAEQSPEHPSAPEAYWHSWVEFSQSKCQEPPLK
jgi:hypothetical protein